MNTFPSNLQKIEGLNFVAFDFETANNARRSACSLGVAKVVDGLIVETKQWYIRPDPFEVGHYQKRVHGLSLDFLSDKPLFPDVWEECREYFIDQTIVAHNLGFDMSALRYVCDHYGIEVETDRSFCTFRSAKANWENELSYGLSYLCARIGHQFSHHDALEDAVACAMLARELAVQNKVNDLLGCPPYTYITKKVRKEKDINPVLNLFDTSNESRVSGKRIVFSGALRKFSRSDAHGLAIAFGAIPTDSVSRTTDFLVVGSFDWGLYGEEYKSSKIRKAQSMIKSGHEIEVITEDDFYALIGI